MSRRNWWSFASGAAGSAITTVPVNPPSGILKSDFLTSALLRLSSRREGSPAMAESALHFDRPERFPCPACPTGVLALAVEMAQAVIYLCDGDRCGAALWVPTESGHMAEQIRMARLRQAAYRSNQEPTSN